MSIPGEASTFEEDPLLLWNIQRNSSEEHGDVVDHPSWRIMNADVSCLLESLLTLTCDSGGNLDPSVIHVTAQRTIDSEY